MRKVFIIFIIGLLIVFTFYFLTIDVWQGVYLPKLSGSPEKKLFSIARGETIFQIAENLEKEGLIKNKSFFEIYVILKGKRRSLQAGEYNLGPSMTIPEMTKEIVSGKAVKEKITIIEGWNLRDIGGDLENRGMFKAEELFELVGFPMIDYSKAADLPKPKDFSQEFDFLKDYNPPTTQYMGLEGYLFPDTYEINKGDSIEKLVRKMLDNFDKKLTPDLRKEISRQGKTIFQVVTMASLLEKEVKTIEDRRLVSGILWKRLENNMPLQVDATIIYITGKRTTKISKEETQIDSPYNTYKYRGLPMGPICNPSEESIKAAINPEPSDSFYYLSLPDGKTKFSKTLEEHNKAKQEYLKF